MLGAILGTRIAVARSWLPRARLRGAATGAAIGFLLAASIAVNTLSTPVGPVLSTLLIGVGEQGAFQTLDNAAGLFYGLTYVVLFAIPVIGLRRSDVRVSLWLRVVASVGLATACCTWC